MSSRIIKPDSKKPEFNEEIGVCTPVRVLSFIQLSSLYSYGHTRSTHTPGSYPGSNICIARYMIHKVYNLFCISATCVNKTLNDERFEDKTFLLHFVWSLHAFV